MKFRRNYGEFLNEQSHVNEDHLMDREDICEFIYKSAPAAGYPDFADMHTLSALDDNTLENIYKMIEAILKFNDIRESADMFVYEKSDHEGWLVVGFDQDTKTFEVLSIPLIKKEAIRFLQSFEAQMSKMADRMKKYTKLKLAHASDVFEGTLPFDDEEYVNEELYDFVQDIKRALGKRNRKSAIEDYLGRELSQSEIQALKRAGVMI